MVGDSGRHGGLEEERPEIRPGLAADHELGAAVDGVRDVGLDRLQLVSSGERADLGGVVVGGPEGERPRGLGEAREEAVVELLVYIDPLDPDADLAGVGEAGLHSASDRCVDVGVGAHDHRVLAAELQRGPDQPAAGLRGQLAAGGGRAGEGQVVDLVEQGRPDDRPAAGDHLPHVVGKARLARDRPGGQQAQRRLRVGLAEHRVARQQRRDHVAHGEEERVVPRGDDADQPLRVPGDPGAHDAGHAGRRSGLGEVRRRVTGVVHRHRRQSQELDPGVDTGLAGLPLDDVEHLLLVLEQQRGEPEHDRGPLGQWYAGPARLRDPGPPRRLGDVGGGGLRDRGQQLAGEGRDRR